MPTRKSILPGKTFGRLTVVAISATKPRYYACVCTCGVTKEVFISHLVGGKIISCGCYHKEVVSAQARKRNTTHKMYGTRAYITWNSMINRCGNENSPNYKNYGARGITVCNSWNDFNQFYKDMGDPPAGLSLERVDNEKHYSKDNCIWATRSQQANNKRTSIKITYNGKTQTVSNWCHELNIKRGYVYDRIAAGWDRIKALTTPPRKTKS